MSENNGEKAVFPVLKIAFRNEENKFWGPGVAQLMRHVDECHSLRAAAMKMGMSYSKAWRIVHEAEDGFGFALMERSTGGSEGGGSQLTDRGRALLCAYAQMVDEVQTAVDRAFLTHAEPILKERER